MPALDSSLYSRWCIHSSSGTIAVAALSLPSATTDTWCKRGTGTSNRHPFLCLALSLIILPVPPKHRVILIYFLYGHAVSTSILPRDDFSVLPSLILRRQLQHVMQETLSIPEARQSPKRCFSLFLYVSQKRTPHGAASDGAEPSQTGAERPRKR